jgi:hypothetical protein
MASAEFPLLGGVAPPELEPPELLAAVPIATVALVVDGIKWLAAAGASWPVVCEVVDAVVLVEVGPPALEPGKPPPQPTRAELNNVSKTARRIDMYIATMRIPQRISIDRIGQPMHAGARRCIPG